MPYELENKLVRRSIIMGKKSNHVMQTIVDHNYPVVDRAEGMYIYDTEGNKYLDVAAGVSVSNIGHGNKKVLAAMEEQMNKVTFVYAGHFTNDKRKELANKIIEIAPEGMDKVFFCSGGSEAIESVIKISRQYHLEKGNDSKYKIISRWLSYHGNTIGTLSVGGRRSWRYKYEPYLLQMPHIPQCNCYRCTYGLSYPGCGLPCAAELERVISYEGPETVAAFLIEPIVGTTTAALMPPKEYIKEVRRISCRWINCSNTDCKWARLTRPSSITAPGELSLISLSFRWFSRYILFWADDRG